MTTLALARRRAFRLLQGENRAKTALGRKFWAWLHRDPILNFWALLIKFALKLAQHSERKLQRRFYALLARKKRTLAL